MSNILTNVSIQVNDKIYLKDPDTSELGRKIISGGIEMIDEMGFESFTFRKLGVRINSTEASIYRYFENKHKLLLYLISWYWGWMEYRLVFGLANIPSPVERLMRAITLLTEEITQDESFEHIDRVKLNHIVINDSSKTYLTKQVDEENKEGVFLVYKEVVARISDIIMEINPDYKYPHMLISTVIEAAHHQRFFAEHLPRLTDVVKGEDSITEFSKETVLKAIDQS